MIRQSDTWDVLVIGGGHAGCEAAHSSARLGCRTALTTLNPDRIGFMSCNPAMGGLAKGQLIKEIDALGGVMGRITDRTAIQYRRLNASKGPAVRSSRAQCDKALYAATMGEFLGTVPNLTVLKAEILDLLIEDGKIAGVTTSEGETLRARTVVITSGTFLRAVMHTGFERTSGGRAGDVAAMGLSASLERLGFQLGRLKTGTPPRLHRRSIDYGKMERQPGDRRPVPFSFYFAPDPFPLLPQIDCWITYTNSKTHDFIAAHFDQSPIFTGVIQGVGPRYCPSIEDKVKRFSDKERHQIFLEPEGLSTDEMYVNGISTSLPGPVQEVFVRTIPGFEKAEFIRYGYAVEYDSIDARQLRATLESKDIPGLFFAGQVNGTSGYEEAGAQGLIAGLNAALSVRERDPFLLTRLDGYIGVLIDDLVTRGTDEPYRMFTSRAEYRLLLREDNADLRLSEKGYRVGLLGEECFRSLTRRRQAVEQERERLRNYFFSPTQTMNDRLGLRGLPPLKDRVSAEGLLRRPEIDWKDLVELEYPGPTLEPSVQEQVEIQVKYEGYIRRDLELLEGMRKNEDLRIPASIDFNDVPGLSHEIKGRLRTSRPETVGQASRMMGMTPAAVANLVIYLKMRRSSPQGQRVEHGNP